MLSVSVGASLVVFCSCVVGEFVTELAGEVTNVVVGEALRVLTPI